MVISHNEVVTEIAILFFLGHRYSSSIRDRYREVDGFNRIRTFIFPLCV